MPTPSEQSQLIPRFLQSPDTGEWSAAVTPSLDEAVRIFADHGYKVEKSWLEHVMLAEVAVPREHRRDFDHWWEPRADGDIEAWEYRV